MDDEMKETKQSKFIPMLMSLGAVNAYNIWTSETTAMQVTVFPDEAAKSSAMKKIAEIRSQGASEFSATMTKAEEGHVIAHG